MQLQVRKLQESDWDLIPKWWEAYKAEGFPRDMLPGSFKVGDEQEEKRTEKKEQRRRKKSQQRWLQNNENDIEPSLYLFKLSNNFSWDWFSTS